MSTPEQLAETVRGALRNPGMFPDGAEAFDSLLAAYEEMRRERDEQQRVRGLLFRDSERAQVRAEAAEREVERLTLPFIVFTEALDRAETAEREVERLRSALDRLLRNAERIFDKTPVRDWAETLAEARAALGSESDGG